MREHSFPKAEEMMLFRDVQRAHHNAVSAALAARGVEDVGQPRLLLVLNVLREGGAAQWELAEAIHVSPSTVTTSLKSLERRGYVTRQSDMKDGRCKRVVITRKGLDAVAAVQEAFNQVDEQLFAGFTPEEVARIRTDYQRMLNNLYAIGGNCSAESDPADPLFYP